jgi:hypothetical protein
VRPPHSHPSMLSNTVISAGSDADALRAKQKVRPSLISFAATKERSPGHEAESGRCEICGWWRRWREEMTSVSTSLPFDHAVVCRRWVCDGIQMCVLPRPFGLPVNFHATFTSLTRFISFHLSLRFYQPAQAGCMLSRRLSAPSRDPRVLFNLIPPPFQIPLIALVNMLLPHSFVHDPSLTVG